MKIQDLKPKKGSRKPGKRKGRGMGSGSGKTSGRGHKGQNSRTGGGKRVFASEGGQMPLVRRIPKVGFTSKNKKYFNIINMETLNSFKDETNVTPSLLKKSSIIKNTRLPVKILGKGELKKKLNIRAHAFSAQAKAQIEKAGGKAEIIKC